MRARLFFFTIFLAVPLIIFSQDEIGTPKLKPSGTYWGIGYYASVNVNAFNDYVKSRAEQVGWGGSVELSFNDGRNNFLVTASKNKINYNNDESYYETVEFLFGPRIKLDKHGNYFTEILAGGVGLREVYHNYFEDYNYYVTYSKDIEYNFGLSAGLGMKVDFSKNTSMIFKIRLITTLPLDNTKMLTYLSAGGGIVFNSSGDKVNKKENKKSYFGFTALAGLNNPNTFKNDDYQWSPSYGGEMNYRLYSQLEMIVTAIYNPMKFNNNENISNHKIVSAAGGGRFFISENPYTAFIEIMGGLYEYTFKVVSNVTEETYEAAEDNFGLSLGTGVKLKIYKPIDFIIKSDLNFIFSGKYQDSPDFLTVHGGLRFNL